MNNCRICFVVKQLHYVPFLTKKKNCSLLFQDLIIEAIYSGVLKGKLNPKEQKVTIIFLVNWLA